MRLDVTHVTRYTYAAPVRLEPHTLRLRPRTDAFQRLLSFELAIDPAPAGIEDGVDLDGGCLQRVRFTGETRALRLQARARVETRDPAPCESLLEPWALTLPFLPPLALASRLQPFLATPAGPGVLVLARTLADEQDHDSVRFLAALARHIHAGCAPTIRELGEPLPAEETLARGAGTCRDLAVLFMAACRAQGLAARFVSGYLYPETHPRTPTLHAWCEVFLPGAGWRGYDPSLGRATGAFHVAVASGPAPRDAAPVEGTYRGTPEQRLEAQVEMSPSLALA